MYTISKKAILELFQAAGQQRNEDIRLRVNKDDAMELADTYDASDWHELLPEFLPRPKRYIITSRQFEGILHHQLEKKGKIK